MSPETALVAGRWLQDASVMLLWGGCAYLAALVPRALAGVAHLRLAGLWTALAATGVAATVAMLPLEAATIGNGWRDALDPATLRAVLFETAVGRAWLVQGVLALLLALALALPSRVRRPVLAPLSGLLLASLALRGHAAMHSGWLGVAHHVNDAVHVLCAGAWLGALVPLLPILSALAQPARRLEAVAALRRFSTAGHAAVALVLASGVVNTWLVLGRWPADWASRYQALLALKIAVVAAMVALAVFNRYGLVPRLGRQRPGTLGAIRRAVGLEIVLGLAAVALVASFGMLEPA